ncbi:outer membrane beta-barrel protein [Pedobacter insulae]|uniref:Outer membrane protein beta-barrel domain-containing protein n=1 Tax=Pedobacter insulae TaxID=414048 RepID=A0A1I2VPB9_9SPHI|nr:outer membrane beta-barrel protein [Pedobacter insulae]SFG91154.1 Outer membrane protein beta-barrel domain-containing protein [Pedobacter insulae]
MKKILLSFSLIAGLTLSVFAQQQNQKIKVGIGGEFLYALGSTAEFYNLGYGVSAQGEYLFSPKLSATLSGGYMVLTINKLFKEIYEEWDVKIDSKTFYPVKAGLKYNLNKTFYAAAEAGASISKDKTARGNSFAYAGGLGSSFEVSSKASLDFGLRYEEWAVSAKDRLSFIGFRAAYSFGL